MNRWRERNWSTLNRWTHLTKSWTSLNVWLVQCSHSKTVSAESDPLTTFAIARVSPQLTIAASIGAFRRTNSPEFVSPALSARLLYYTSALTNTHVLRTTRTLANWGTRQPVWRRLPVSHTIPIAKWNLIIYKQRVFRTCVICFNTARIFDDS